MIRRRDDRWRPAPRGLLAILLLGLTLGSPSASAAISFIRGDSDASGGLQITDPIRTLLYLFADGEPLDCERAADVDANGSLTIVDPIYTLNYLFGDGPPPVDPFPDCGVGEESEALPCERFDACATELEEIDRIRASFGMIETIAGKGENPGAVNAWESDFEGGAATEAELSRPHIALSDDEGNIFIADKDAHAIRRVTPSGSITTVAGTGEAGDDGDEAGPAVERRLAEPNGLWVRGDGTFYILDKDNEKIRRVSVEGTMTTLFSVGGLRTGRGLWVSDDETLAYVASRTAIVRWTPDDGAVAFATGFSQLGNFVVEPSTGDLLATDRNAHRVYRVDGAGTRTAIAGNGATGDGIDGANALETALDEVRGIWLPRGLVEESSGYFLATQAGSQVWYVDSEGVIHLFIDGGPDGEHSGDGEAFDAPGKKISRVRSVTADRFGNLLITEHDAGFVRRVVRIEPSIP